MANTYFKVQRGNFKQENFTSEFDCDFRNMVNSSLNEDLYSLVSGMHKNKLRPANIDMNTLIKYYIINKLMDTPQKAQNNLINKLKRTSNPNIKKDIEGRYYRVSNGQAELDTSILSVMNDGSYIVKEVRQYCPFKIIRTYNIENQAISIQIHNHSGEPISDKWQIAEILNLRQELKTKYKYSGYSGNSKEILAKVLNKFSKPLPTGYYMDSNCLIWKWNYTESSFNRVFEREAEMPLMSDIEFKENGTVIRQEYTGILN